MTLAPPAAAGGARRTGWLGVLGLALVAAVVALDVAASGPLAGLDAPVLAALARLRSPGLDPVVRAVTDAGGGWGRCALGAVVAGVLAVRARRAQRGGRPAGGLPWWAPLAAAAAALALTPLVNEGLKALAGRARPPVASAIDVATGAAFPSGHAMGSAALAVVLARLVAVAAQRRAVTVAALVAAVAYAAAVGLSRSYLGVHWPSDVLAGWAAGAAVGGAVLLLTARLTAAPAPPRGTGSR